MIGPSLEINEWCEHRRVSRAMFYKLEKQGKAPRTHSVGRKRLVGPEADADWLRAREAETTKLASQSAA